MRTLTVVSTLVGLSIVAGCGEPLDLTPPGDPATPEIAARTQGLTVTEGSPEALGIVRVANELPAAVLTAQVRLTAAQAAAIVAYRSGPDATAGTADDRRFTTVAQIDAVPGIGEASIAKLLSYATAQGYVVTSDDPFDPGSCSGFPMTAAETALRLSGRSSIGLGRYQVVAERRFCSGGRCNDWEPSYAPDGEARLVKSGTTTKLTLLDSDCDTPATYVPLFGAECTDVTAASVNCAGYYEFTHMSTNADGRPVCVGTSANLGSGSLQLAGLVGSRCMRLIGNGTQPSGFGTFEYRAALLLRY